MDHYLSAFEPLKPNFVKYLFLAAFILLLTRLHN